MEGSVQFEFFDNISGFLLHNFTTLDMYRNGAHARERLAFKRRIKMWEEPQADD